ncbi:MAG: HD domain-containing protein [Patescibacteria group bacterium]
MKEILHFLIQVNKLKEVQRSGWILRGVKNPETIADHMFRLAFFCWLLSHKKGNLEIGKVIKTALSHDLCEVYAGDIVPYFGILPKNEEKRKEVLKRWVRLPRHIKSKRDAKKFKLEKKGLLKLIKILEPKQRQEILTLWLNQDRSRGQLGKFVKQADKIETMIQAIEYFGAGQDTPVTGWWEESEELVDDQLLLILLKVIQRKFYGDAEKLKKIEKINQELEDILDFTLLIGRLKSMPRLYWTLREIDNPETVAGHIFTLSIMAWVFGKKKKELSQEKLLKMALCHELASAEIGDSTPYDRILSGDPSEGKKVLEKMIHLSRKEKKRIFIEDYKKEKKALETITAKLSPHLKREIIYLWEDYRAKKSPEARFLNQLNTLSILFQGLLYEKKYKHFSAKPLWEWAFEACDDPLLIRFMEEMKKKFHIRYFLRDLILQKLRVKK